MLDALTITEAEAAGLSELAALDLAMARDFAARARAAEDPEVANDLPAAISGWRAPTASPSL